MFWHKISSTEKKTGRLTSIGNTKSREGGLCQNFPFDSIRLLSMLRCENTLRFL